MFFQESPIVERQVEGLDDQLPRHSNNTMHCREVACSPLLRLCSPGWGDLLPWLSGNSVRCSEVACLSVLVLCISGTMDTLRALPAARLCMVSALAGKLLHCNALRCERAWGASSK